MERDPFYARCCLTGKGKKTENRFDPNRIEWHHNLIFAGKQVQKKFAILPVIKHYHDRMVGQTKELCDWIMLNRATDQELAEYSKARDLFAERERLNNKYGPWPKKKKTNAPRG